MRSEVGYILIEECDVLVTDASPCCPLLPTSSSFVWHDIDIQSVRHSQHNYSVDDDNSIAKKEDEYSNNNLVLTPSSSTGLTSTTNDTNDNDNNKKNVVPKDDDKITWRLTFDVQPFDGLMSQLIQNMAVSNSSSGMTRRSDASLIVGLAMAINNYSSSTTIMKSNDRKQNENSSNIHLMDLRTESVQILFHSIDDNEEKDAAVSTTCIADDNNETNQSHPFIRVKASLLLTFSLPTTLTNNSYPIACCQDDVDSKSEISSIMISQQQQQQQQQRKRNGSKKIDSLLPPCYKLLASIIRCDWDHLDQRMNKMKRLVLDRRIERMETMLLASNADTVDDVRGKAEPTSKMSFFPDFLDVEQLYDRISGASRYLGDKINDEGGHESKVLLSSSRTIVLADIPNDIIATYIAPFLRARSLYSLRVTNRKFYHALRSVVPGLKLQLFHHQIQSLEWMEMRERQCVLEKDFIHYCGSRRSCCHNDGEAACGGDYHRAITGGATVLLRPRHVDYSCDALLLRFDSESGVLLSFDETKKLTRCARGGLLCDDPGLGKTITSLSLILRSFGLCTDTQMVVDAAMDDTELFNAYWKSSFLSAHDRRTSVLQLITRLVKSDKYSAWFVPLIDPILDGCPDYYDVISTPISLQAIRMKYKTDCLDFNEFERDIELCFANAMCYNPPDHVVHKAAERLSKKFKELSSDFKATSISNASKSTFRLAKDPSTISLFNHFEAKKNAQLLKSLLPSSATLLVVPSPLINHWKEQMIRHIDFNYISKQEWQSSPSIYYHTSKRNLFSTSTQVSFSLSNVIDPIIFIDDGSKELPHPSVLARFRIVLTSYTRFTSEWKNGNVEMEIRASKKNSGDGGNYWGDDVPEASSLLKVSWLRVIVDEGHVLGKSANNLFQFASWLPAERLWAMTGTPTPQISTQNGLKNLFHMSNFLKHDFFNQRLGGENDWNSLISSGWRLGHVPSFFRLKHLVSYLMVRHTKADLVEIPPPEYSMANIELSQAEIATYNTLVSGIRSNIITTSMKGKTSGWQDSLLNPRQSKYASEALRNLRVACCGGATILPQITSKHWEETLEMCRVNHNLDEIQIQVVNNFIHRVQGGELSGCHKCGIQLQTLFVIPCGHLVCTECINNTTSLCPVCQDPFDVDDFQRLQPGLDNQFCLNLQEEMKERESRFALKRAFAEESSRTGRPSGAADSLLGVAAVSSARSHKKGESCVYSSLIHDGKCTVCREEHYECDFMNGNKQCSLCFKYAEECPVYNQKALYVIKKLLRLRENHRTNCSPMAVRLFATSGVDQTRHRPLKAIVFSQFRAIYEYFGDKLIRRFGGACVADYSYGGTRTQELQKFIYQPECFVMLLSKQGAVGLDLSFVTHIFFLDSVFDASLRTQVVARAYRMGATGSVCVEQLTAKNTIEEVMNEMNNAKQIDQSTSDANSDPAEKHAKLHQLLISAKLIRPLQKSTMKKRKVMEDATDADDQSKSSGVRFKD